MNSFNHYAFGAVGEWLYRFLLGIDQEPGTAGFGRLLLRPHPGGSLDWAPGAHDAQEAVFHIGSGAHEFSGPALHE